MEDSSESSISDDESEEEYFSNLLYKEEIDIIIDSFIKRIETSKKAAVNPPEKLVKPRDVVPVNVN